MVEDIKLGVADDHKLVRNGIVNLLASRGFNVVCQCDDGQQLLDYARSNPLDIVLMDLNMPVLNGWETTKALYDQCPKVKVIGLSMFDDDLSVLRIIRAGARGYLLKDAEPDELVRAIQEVHTSGFYHSDLVSDFLYRNYSGGSNAQEDLQGIALSDRELNFLKHCCSELTYKEIADRMNVSPRTVDGYREALFEKFRVRSRVGIVITAVKHHLIEF